MGKLMEVMATELDKKSSESLKMEPLDININISGNITLEGTDVSNDMVSKLMEKKTFVDRILDLVTVKLNYMEHNVLNMKSLVNRFPNLTS
jgi:transcriptional regulator of aromatic amino acid metabolism